MRLIDADALEREIMVMTDDELCEDCCYNVVNKLSAAPTVDAVPVKHGRWHDSDFVPGLLSCSICGAQRNPNFKLGGGRWDYCPNCGAKMDRERKDTK